MKSITEHMVLHTKKHLSNIGIGGTIYKGGGSFIWAGVYFCILIFLLKVCIL